MKQYLLAVSVVVRPVSGNNPLLHVFHLTSARLCHETRNKRWYYATWKEHREGMGLITNGQRGDQLWDEPLTAVRNPPACASHSPPTCVEDTGGEGRRRRLVQEQLPHHHPDRVPGKSPLQETHPEEIEVAMETKRDHRDVPCLSPLDGLPPGEPLVDEVPPGEQAAVQCHVGNPRKATGMS